MIVRLFSIYGHVSFCKLLVPDTYWFASQCGITKSSTPNVKCFHLFSLGDTRELFPFWRWRSLVQDGKELTVQSGSIKKTVLRSCGCFCISTVKAKRIKITHNSGKWTCMLTYMTYDLWLVSYLFELLQVFIQLKIVQNHCHKQTEQNLEHKKRKCFMSCLCRPSQSHVLFCFLFKSTSSRVIVFAACSVLDDILSVWNEVWVIRRLSVLSDGFFHQEQPTLKCHHVLHVQLWLHEPLERT